MSRLSMMLGAAAFALLLAGGLFVVNAVSEATPNAVAQPAQNEISPVPSDDHVPLVARDFFKPYPAGPGEIPYNQLVQFDKDLVAKKQEWAETAHGDAVHQAWRAGTNAGIEYAALKHAEREAALQGIDKLGVQP